jgi:hypothetical protein
MYDELLLEGLPAKDRFLIGILMEHVRKMSDIQNELRSLTIELRSFNDTVKDATIHQRARQKSST